MTEKNEQRIPAPTKRCTKCDCDRELSMYRKDKRYRSGYSDVCMACEMAEQPTETLLQRHWAWAWGQRDNAKAGSLRAHFLYQEKAVFVTEIVAAPWIPSRSRRASIATT